MWPCTFVVIAGADPLTAELFDASGKAVVGLIAPIKIKPAAPLAINFFIYIVVSLSGNTPC